MEAEFNEIEERNLWPTVYQEIRNEAQKYKYTNKDSKKSENKNLNRYRDVTPFDHSRIKLTRGQNNYINASLIEVESANRAYILTQGPLNSTVSHFWSMIWEKNSKAILMLNRLVEQEKIKCHQYWPNGAKNDDKDELILDDVSLKVEYKGEERTNTFTKRNFILTDTESNDSRTIIQYHYTSWPDFGLPESPASFLGFLVEVRKCGALDLKTFGPPVVHCSAGIGRSGTFCLVDTCLVLFARSNNAEKVNVRQVLLDMRKYRMGLVQTLEQLRFSYLAIIEGRKLLSHNDNGNVPSGADNSSNAIQDISCNDNRDEKDESENEEEKATLPLLPPRIKKPETSPSNAASEGSRETTGYPTNNNIKTSSELRFRAREERIQKTVDNIKRIKDKQKQNEERSRLKKTVLNGFKMGCVTLGFALVLGGGFIFYHNYLTSDVSPMSYRSTLS